MASFLDAIANEETLIFGFLKKDIVDYSLNKNKYIIS